MSNLEQTIEVQKHKVLLLALGNDIMGDDGVGWAAARILQQEGWQGATFVEAAVAGFALLELMEDYEKVLILDAVQTGVAQPGAIVEFAPNHFHHQASSSPHYVGFPEIFALAERLKISFPHEVKILAMEVRDPFELRESLSDEIQLALPALVQRAGFVLQEWGCALPVSASAPMLIC